MDTNLESRLTNWAHWILSIRNGEAGYPAKSITALIAEGMLLSSKKSGKSYPIYNPKAEEIDYHYRWIVKNHPHYADAIYDYYTSQDTIVTLAKNRGISKRTFYERVQKAKEKIQERLVS